VLVSTAAVSLRGRQAVNAELDRKRNVLMAAGVMDDGETLSPAEVDRRFASFEVVAVNLRTGDEDPLFDASGYDARRATSDPRTSKSAPRNDAQVARLPNHALVYKQRGASGQIELLILPVEGKGLWSTMYGFLALGPDLRTIRGLTFFQHGETPGLGGEVDNPRWKGLWPGRQAFDREGQIAIEVIRGRAGAPGADPHHVDGLSGATITSRGVTALLRFWLGDQGFGAYLTQLRADAGIAPAPR